MLANLRETAMRNISHSMFITVAALALTAGYVGSPASAQEPQTAEVAQIEDERLAAFFEEIFQRNLQESPLFQTQIGLKTADYGKWDDFSDAEAIRQNERTKSDLARLHDEFDYDSLSEQSKVSYRIFEFLQERALKGFKWRFHNYGFSTMNNPVSQIVTFMQNAHQVETVADAEAYISRIIGLARVSEQVVENLGLSEQRGVVPTSFSFDPVLADTRALLKGAPFDDSTEDSALYADFRGKVKALEVNDIEKNRLLTESRAAMTGPFKTAIETYLTKVESLREKSHGENGVWKLPKGREYYKYQMEFWTSETGMTADQVHKIGLKDVSRIRGEMEIIMQEVGFDGDLPAFFEFLRTDPNNFYPDNDEGRQAYLDLSKAYIDAVYQDVEKDFNILPKAPLEVRAVEKWREETAPIAFYNRPTPDGSRPGIYYTNLKDMTKKQIHEIETIAYHEGAPGHHFQLAIQQELEGVPTFQNFAFFGAYTEGWGLYAERLAKEQGRFIDPMQDFGRLQNEMLRAARLVVDTGSHAKRWTRQQMIDYMMDNNPMTLEEATKEVERYIDTPGQALSYKVGMMKILELREKAKAHLNDKYDNRDFHDVVLKNGAVPLSILEELVDAYIALKKAA